MMKLLESKPLKSMHPAKIHLVVMLLILLLAVFLRISAARYAYPTPGDANHFVQHAIAMAHGGMKYMSTYWSQGMIFLGYLAIKTGLDPHLSLQYFTLICGVLVVLFAALIAGALSNSNKVAWIVGLLCATLPPLVRYSVIAFSEMSFMAFFLAGMYCALNSVKKKCWYVIPGAVCIGISFYFKGADAMVGSSAIAGYFMLFFRDYLWDHRGKILISIMLFFATISPLFLLTYSRSDSVQPGSKIVNIVFGRDWSNSKAVGALNKPWAEREAYWRQHGIARFIWHYRHHFIERIKLNAGDYIRLVNDLMFQKTFRVGTGWFLLFVAGSGVVIYKKYKLYSYTLLIMIIGLSGAAMLLFFFHERLLVPMLPFYVMLAGMAFAGMLSSILNGAERLALLATAIAIVATNCWHASGVAEGKAPWWPYYNRLAVAQKLHDYGGEDLKILASGDAQISVYFYKQNPLVAKRIPFAELKDVEEYASLNEIDMIVVSDKFNPHWPIADVFRQDVVLPENWTVVHDFTLRNDDWRVPDDRWLFIARAHTSQ